MQVVDVAPADPDLAGGERLQPGDDVEQGRLAAARRPDQHQEAALLDRKLDVLEDVELAEALVEGLDLEECHGLTP